MINGILSWKGCPSDKNIEISDISLVEPDISGCYSLTLNFWMSTFLINHLHFLTVEITLIYDFSNARVALFWSYSNCTLY